MIDGSKSATYSADTTVRLERRYVKKVLRLAVVVVEGVSAGTAMTGWVMDDDRTIALEARQDIPIGHKVALKDLAPGDTVIKYGIDMGKVVAPIRRGEHAHVHNVKTKRW